MFKFIMKIFIVAFVGCGALISSNPLQCVTMNNGKYGKY